MARVAVIGGSLGGLNAALWLHGAGCDVEVFERARAALEGRGAGIVLNPAAVRYFVANEAVEISAISASARWSRYLARDGGVAREEPCSYLFTSYDSLYRGLLGCFERSRYHLGRECVGCDQDAEGVTARFADGGAEQCDLLVYADGVNSTGRRLLLPDVGPRYAGYIAWRGTVSEAELSGETFAALREAITYHLQPDGHALAYPIPDHDGAVEPGHRLTNWLWYRNVSEGPALDDLLTGTDGVRLASSLPPGQVRPEQLERLREEAAAALPAPFAEVIAATGEPFIQVVFDVQVPRMAFGRACLIGDAAITLRPHVAAGTAKAAEDGWKLAEALRRTGGEVSTALGEWEREQLALGGRLAARARDAGARLQGGGWRIGAPLPFGLHEPGDSSMMWTVPARGLNHVSVSYESLEESLAFYTELFGMEKIPTPNFGMPVQWLRLGGHQLHLFERPGSPPTYHHFALTVSLEDFEEVYRKASARDVLDRTTFGHHLNELPGDCAQLYLRDPAGNLVEVDALGASRLSEAVRGDLRRLADVQPQDEENQRATLFLDGAP